MSRVFCIPTVLRTVPHDLLRRFLESLGHGSLNIPWGKLKKRDPLPIIEAIQTLPPAQINEIDAALHLIFNLGCDTGIPALREAREWFNPPPPLTEMPDDATPLQHSMNAWIASRELAQRAARIHQVENLTWWRKRRDLPAGTPTLSPENIDRFAQELPALLLATEGRGRRCTVDPMTRKGVEYLFAHSDDFAQHATAHGPSGLLEPCTFRHTFPIVFAYSPCERTLETFAKVSPRTKPKIEALFARIFLGVEALPVWPKRPTFELQHLKERSFSFETDPADGIWVDVRYMLFRYRNSQRQVGFEGDPRWRGDTHNLIEDALNRDRVPLAELDLRLVRLEFGFSDGIDPGTVELNVSNPGSCNLRNLPPHRADMIQKYLWRWGIDGNGPDDPNLEAA